MASHFSSIFVSLLLLSLFLDLITTTAASAAPRKLLSLVQQQALVLKYHNGPLLNGNITLHLVWYGSFSPLQRSLLVDFLRSLDSGAAPAPAPHSVSSWWQTIHKYKGASSSALAVGRQVLDEGCSLGKSLKSSDIVSLASVKSRQKSDEISVVLTAADVAVEGFCMSRCGTHGSVRSKAAYAWVGNSETQCPGKCAWPFHQPQYGPQAPPLVSPNGDVGIDGMVINLATVLAGAVTNPFDDGYFQGSAQAPLEAVSACTGIFGAGAYPGYPGQVLVDGTTGGSYNAVGLGGRKYLLPAMWDPQTSTCKTLV